jgi:hypothetical protein
MVVLMKRIASYQQTKPAADGLKMATDKDAYRSAHESELIIHEAAATRAIRKTIPPGSKLSSLATLQAEYTSLTERKGALRAGYGKFKSKPTSSESSSAIWTPSLAMRTAEARRKNG